MNKHSRSPGFSFFAILTALAAVFPGIPLFAQMSAPISVGPSTSISLPPGWKVTSVAPDEPNQPGGNIPATDPRSTSLLITAAPVDPKRNIMVSFYSLHSHDWGPPLIAGEMGAESEAGKLLHAVLMQGYKPADIQVIKSTSATGVPLVTIQITAKDVAGEERVFSDTSAATPPFVVSTLRLYASRPAADPTGSQEIAGIIHSLIVPSGPYVASAGNRRSPSPTPGPAALPDLQAPPTPKPSNRGRPSWLTPIVQAPAQPASSSAPSPGPVASSNSVSVLGDAAISTKAGQLVSDYHSALILVEGQKGVGSGFLCNLGGHTFAITNAHVLSDNVGVKLTSLGGTTFTAGNSAVAVAHDIVKMEVTGGTEKVFEVMNNLESNAKIGDAVVVPGNAEGASVVRPVEGKIVGIGPNLIEVDAPFVKGCSGSPIIHEATGKVLGIATYLLQRKMDEGGTQVTVETRRFGYRLDSVETWEPINWQAFFAQSAQVGRMEDLSQDFIKMFDDMETQHRLVPENYLNDRLQRSVRSFLEDVNRKRVSKTDKDDLRRGFFADLQSITRNDVSAFNTRTAYDYFRREVEEQSRFRDELYNVFTRLVNNYE